MFETAQSRSPSQGSLVSANTLLALQLQQNTVVNGHGTMMGGERVIQSETSSFRDS